MKLDSNYHHPYQILRSEVLQKGKKKHFLATVNHSKRQQLIFAPLFAIIEGFRDTTTRQHQPHMDKKIL